MPLLVAKQLSDEWFAAHIGRITSSIAGACLGVDKDKSRQYACRKAWGSQKESSWRGSEWGQTQEPKARRAYENATGSLVDPTGLWVHPEYDWLGGSPDGLIDHDGVLELKCPLNLPDRVKPSHRIQCIINCLVTERAWCDYFCWVPVQDQATGAWRITTFLERVYPQGVKGLIHRLERFHRTYILAGEKPARKKPKRRKKK